MPLISFSKSHSKNSPNDTASSSLFANGQKIPPASSSSSSSFLHVNASSTASLSQSHKGGSRTLGRTKDRFSKAFTFSLESFNVVGSIRGRSKPIPNINSNVSSHSISQSYTTYAGYEDEDYGEPDVEAEEIRPPSGLGRPATDLEFGRGVGDEPGPMLSSFSRAPAEPRISESSDDGDSLVEIRYPSGLGNIRLTITPVSITKAKLPARSTYPDFYLQNSQTNLSLHKSKDSTKKTAVPTPSPSASRPVLMRRNFSTSLCKLLPILNSYLDTTTLSRLTLVDRGVGLEARKLLWCRVHMPLRLVISESGTTALLDGRKAASFLDFLSKKDVSHFIRSLELICRLELEMPNVQRPRDSVGTSSITRHPHPRNRPPPLSLVLNNHTMSRNMAINGTQASPTPIPSAITSRTTTTSNPSATRSPFRRASLMIRNSSIPTAIRNSNLGRRLSTLRTPAREQPPQECRATLSGGQSPSSHLTSLSISSSTWQPPPEWERVEREPPPSPLRASLKRAASPSSFRTPTPKSATHPPAAWKNPAAIAKSSPLSPPPSALVLDHTTRRAPSLPNMKPEQPQRRLSLSTLLPQARSTASLNLRSAHTSTSPYHNSGLPQTGSSSQLPPSSFRFEPPTPGTPSVPATPVTPQSAISLSAFPLPPPMTSPRPSVSATPSKLSPAPSDLTKSPHEQSSPQQHPPRSAASTMSHSPFTPNLNRRTPRDVDGLPVESSFEFGARMACSVSTPMEVETRKITITAEQPGFIDGLKMGLKELANLEAVTIRYDIVTSVPSPSADNPNLCFNLVRTANQLFVTSLKDLQALKSIRIACPRDCLSLCSTQLSDLERIFTDVKTSVVVCSSIPQH